MVEVVSKPNLVPDVCVASRVKMLTYYRVCCAFDSACALPSNTIWGFETTSMLIPYKIKPVISAKQCHQNLGSLVGPRFQVLIAILRLYHYLVNPDVLEHAQGNIDAGFAEGPDLSIKVRQPRHRFIIHRQNDVTGL